MPYFPNAMANGAMGTPMDTGAATNAAAPPPQPQPPVPPNSTNPADIEASRYTKMYARAAQAGDKEAMDYFHEKAKDVYSSAAKTAYDPTAGRSDNFAAGMGRGMAHPLAWATGDTSKDDTDKALLANPQGALGDAVGNMVDTLPLGLGTGALASKFGLGMLSRAGLAAGEGGLATAADGGDAATGAGISAALSPVGRVLSKSVGGLVSKSAGAKDLIATAAQHGRDMFIPISQGADSGVARGLYKGLEAIPGVKGKLTRQGEQALEDYRGTASDMASPASSVGGDTQQLRASNLKDQYDKAYERTIKSYAFDTPPDISKNVVQRLGVHGELGDLPSHQKSQIGDIVGGVLDQYKESNGTITGRNLQRAMMDAREQIGNAQSRGVNLGGKAAENEAVGSLHDIVDGAIDDHENMLTPKTPMAQRAKIQSVIDDLKNYKALGPQYAENVGIQKATEGAVADRGAFRPSTLAKYAVDQGPVQKLSQTATEVLENNDGHMNLHGINHIAGGIGAIYHPGVAAALIGGGNALASKTAQKALYGDTAIQQAVAQALRRSPIAAHVLGSAARQGVNINVSR